MSAPARARLFLAARARRSPAALAQRGLAVALLGGTLVAAIAGSAAGQQRLVISGFVQWISGSNMQLQADNGASLRIDLQNVDQSDYNTLENGDRVEVVGVVSPDGSKLIADRVDRSSAPNVYDPYSPNPNTQY